jgi:peroxiredoxin
MIKGIREVQIRDAKVSCWASNLKPNHQQSNQEFVMAVIPPICEFGLKAPSFELPAIDGKLYTYADIAGEKGTIILFICNHCPYVKSIVDRLVRDVKDLQNIGIGAAAIMSNDWDAYPADAPKFMNTFAKENGFTFPYLIDEDQSAARNFDAVCTPDFFGYNKDSGLQYRGRLDAAHIEAAPTDLRRDLFKAMRQVAETGQGPKQQIPSMGCSIKWRNDGMPVV